jgi:hypothetical protein
MGNKVNIPIDRETKAMILGVLKRGHFEKEDFELLTQKYGYEPDDEELTGSIPVADWIKWRIRKGKNAENDTEHE